MSSEWRLLISPKRIAKSANYVVALSFHHLFQVLFCQSFSVESPYILHALPVTV